MTEEIFIGIRDFPQPYLPLLNIHNLDYLNCDHWNTYVPEWVRQEERIDFYNLFEQLEWKRKIEQITYTRTKFEEQILQEKHKNKPKSYKKHKSNIYESKKEHQVEILAPIINQLANMTHANWIIDYDRNVLGIESCEATIHSNLSKYQQELYNHIKYKSTSTIVNSETNFRELFYQTLHCCSSSFLLYYCNENDPCSFTLSHRLIRKKQTKLDRNARMLAVHPFETNKADQALNSGVWYRALMQVLLVEVDGLTTGLQDIKLEKLTKRYLIFEEYVWKALDKLN
ncbi:unnamed protein product [Rotaria sordida]|uniref:Uncharacterized protein n=1 Tax=Rotaria sordida TaxID=392033 RepID=A0A815S3R8_9BILA|nr:unnamed protein product [Rotaria sordida]CAF1486693.1 unnamed protein product [Rotaria sordida]